MAGIIVADFESQIADGMEVYDINSDKIGKVQQYDVASGWFETEKGGLFKKDRYIPFSAIDRIDLGVPAIYLLVTKDYVKDMYEQPPSVKVDVAAGPRGIAAVGTMDSGYGGRMVVDDATFSKVVQQLQKGPQVYDSNGAMIGRVYQYDPASGWAVVEKGKFFPKDLYVPVTALDYLDTDGIHLRVTKEALQDAFALMPANVTFVAITR